VVALPPGTLEVDAGLRVGHAFKDPFLATLYRGKERVPGAPSVRMVEQLVGAEGVWRGRAAQALVNER
jgi:hypothetical protein